MILQYAVTRGGCPGRPEDSVGCWSTDASDTCGIPNILSRRERAVRHGEVAAGRLTRRGTSRLANYCNAALFVSGRDEESKTSLL